MIYLDNAATTKPCGEAVSAMVKAAEEFGNPSSLHGLGLNAEKMITEAKDTLARMLAVDKKGIYFTSGGTEANNLAIFGTVNALRRQGNRIITSQIEHPSVLSAFKKLESEGFEVIYAPVDSDGRVDTQELKKYLDESVIFVSIMHVNNETGVIQPIEEISAMIKEQSPKAVFHVDCVQSFGKINVNPNRMGADMISASAHKIHGFKGTGLLYTKSNRITPVLYGGQQQNEIRPGTENTGGIAAFAAAAEKCSVDMNKMKEKRNLMKEILLRDIPQIKINGSDEYNSGSVLNVSYIGIKAEILLHSLERHKIYVSTGSACSTHKPQPSHVLTAMGLGQKEISGAVRISFCEYNSDEEVIFAAEKIAQEVETIRKYM